MLHPKSKRIIIITAIVIIILGLIFLMYKNPNTSQNHKIATYKNTTHSTSSHSSDHLLENSKTQNTYKYKFQQMCINNIITCIKIDFDGNFNYKQKYFYLASIIYISKFLDQNIKKSSQNSKSFTQTLKKISLKANGGKRRGYATHNYIEINTELIHSYKEFIEIFTHEAGHIIDLGVIQGTLKKKDRQYTEFGQVRFATDDPSLSYYKISFDNEKTRKSGTNKEEFCSRYGMTDPFEDFAECINLYVNHQNIFKYMSKHNSKLQKKYIIIDHIFQHQYLLNDYKNKSKSIKKLNKTPSRRVWDTTKL